MRCLRRPGAPGGLPAAAQPRNGTPPHLFAAADPSHSMAQAAVKPSSCEPQACSRALTHAVPEAARRPGGPPRPGEIFLYIWIHADIK